MAGFERKIVDRTDTFDDKGCKHPWRWEWVDFEVKVGASSERFGNQIRKLNAAGRAFCVLLASLKFCTPTVAFGR